MRTAEEAIAAFARWDGTAEYPAGSNQNWITEWYGMGAVAWCAMACSRALIAAGFGTADSIDLPGVRTTTAKGWAYCPYVEANFRAAGRWHDGDPQPGDLVLFDWDGDGWSDHIGMVARVDPDLSLYVWEGNTDEGVVRLKHRSLTYVRGFARPPYVVAVTPPQPVQEDDMALPLFGDGPEDRGGGLWMFWGGFRKRVHTPQVWSAWEALGAKHIGVADVAMFDASIDIEAALAARVVVVPGEGGAIDYKAVGEAVADEMYGRLAG